MAELSFDGFNTADATPEADKQRGVKAGKGHFLIVDVADEDDQVVVSTEVLAHEIPGEAGKTMKLWFPKREDKDFFIKRLQRFVYACQLVTPEMITEAINEGRAVEINYEDAYDKTFCAILELGKGDYANKASVVMKFYRDDTPDTEDFPKDMGLSVGSSDESCDVAKPSF